MNDGLLIPCRGVLFDSDGVLVDSDAAVHAAWSRWASAYGLDAEAVTSAVHGRRSADTVRALVDEPRRAEALAAIDRYEIEDAGAVTPVAGALGLARSVPRGRWAVVTSGTRALAGARLTAAGHPRPAAMVCAEDVERGKPAPDGYLAAARALGLPAADCVVLEDAAAGVAAARAANVGAVLGVGERAVDAGADAVVADLRGVSWTAAGLRVQAAALLRPSHR